MARVFIRALILLALVVSPRQLWAQPPLLWWVLENGTALALVEALDSLWVGHEVVILVQGDVLPGEGDGVWVRDGQLNFRWAGEERSAPCPADVGTQVVLVRGWFLDLATLPGAVGMPEHREPDPAKPQPTVVPPVTPGNTWLGLSLGPASRRPDRTPALRFSAEALRLVGPLEVGLALNWEPGEGTELLLQSGAARILRLGVGPSLGVNFEGIQGGRWIVDVQASRRWIRGRSMLDPQAESAWWPGWGVGTRLRTMLPVGGRHRLGAGLSWALDLPVERGDVRLPGGEHPNLRPLTVALELCWSYVP